MSRNWLLLMLACTFMLLWGCRSSRQATFTAREQPAAEPEIRPAVPKEPEVTVRTEQVVGIDQALPETTTEIYFVILGSFRVRDNAKRFQSQLRREGYIPNMLQNEMGLYRISVYTYEDIDLARAKVISIRNSKPKYSDAWVLRRQL